MRLQKLYIKEFKNLKELTIDFANHEGLTLLIGNNGSGKSNLLEAISAIFNNRFDKLYRVRNRLCFFDYDLTYQLDDKSIRLFTANKRLQSDLPSGIKEEDAFPKRIVAIYSGEEDRLFKLYYMSIYNKYVKEIANGGSGLPKMIYVNRFYWAISLLSLAMSDSNGSFLADDLHIGEINSIAFKINKKVFEDFKETPVKLMFKKIIDSGKQEFTLEELKTLLAEYNSNEIFLNLYIAFTPKNNKLLELVRIKFNSNLHVEDLSEGEKKQLLIKAAMECIGSEDTLFLLDEPDSSIHLANKHNILDLVKEYQHNRAIIITTHSPTLTSVFNPEQIILLEKGKIVPGVKDRLTAVRALSGSLDAYNTLFSKKALVLLEGKSDIKYIDKAIALLRDEKEEYKLLDFDFLPMGGTDPDVYTHFLEKFGASNKKIIVIVDRDDAGKKIVKALLGGNERFIDDINISQTNPNVVVMMLPQMYTGAASCTIEDMFGPNIIKQRVDACIAAHQFDKTPFSQLPKFKEKFKESFNCECESSDKSHFNSFSKLLDKMVEAVKK